MTPVSQSVESPGKPGRFSLPNAVTAVFPKALTQLCVVHLVRASLRYVNSRDSKAVIAALKRIYQSASAEEAEARELGLDHSLFPVSPGDPQGDLYHQCD